MLGRRYRQSSPLWPIKKNRPPKKTNKQKKIDQTCNYSNTSTPKESPGRGWERVRQKERAKRRGKELVEWGNRRRGEKSKR